MRISIAIRDLRQSRSALDHRRNLAEAVEHFRGRYERTIRGLDHHGLAGMSIDDVLKGRSDCRHPLSRRLGIFSVLLFERVGRRWIASCASAASAGLIAAEI